MTDPHSTIFEPAPPKSRFFIPTLVLIACFVAVIGSTILYDLRSVSDDSIRRSLLVVAIFIVIPLTGGILLFLKRKLGWYIITVYFVVIGTALSVSKTRDILENYQYGYRFLFDWRLDSMLLPALGIIVFILTRDVQRKIEISNRHRKWTIIIAAISALAFVIFLYTIN
jgi:hypothetical protein